MKESVIFFHHVNSWHQIQGVRFVSRHLYLLSHLAIPDLMYFYITNGEVILARRDNQEVRKCRMETGEEWRSCGLMGDAEDTRVLGGMMSLSRRCHALWAPMDVLIISFTLVWLGEC